MCLALLASLAACEVTPRAKSNELARVAKDWCLTIRASQILPVYPLTQDLLVGDVFLTTTPIGKEIAQFEADGFLPLDLHLVRLPAADAMVRFYASQLGDGDAFPKPTSAWQDLPGSAFPTYQFSLSRGGGLNLAIPIEGVPMGFGYLRSSAAIGTVTLKKTETAGLDIDTLRPLLAKWEIDNRGLLAAYARDPGEPDATPVFVRVVTRIYRAGGVVVALNDASAAGAEIAAGIELPAPVPGTPAANMTAAEQYDRIAENLSTTLGTKFGLKARVIGASQRSVTMAEDFTTPMVIGYLAYDCQIMPSGVLSAPVPSYQRLTGRATVFPGLFNSAALLQAWYTQDEAVRVPQVKAWVEQKKPVDDGDEPPANFVEFASSPKWDMARRRCLRDVGVTPR